MSHTQDPRDGGPFADIIAHLGAPGQDWMRRCAELLGLGGASQGAASAPESEEMRALRQEFAEAQGRLWQAMLTGRPSVEAGRFVTPEPGDRRFAAPEWRASPVFDYFHQSYLLSSRYMLRMVDLLPAENEQMRRRLRFFARQMVDALAPSNFAASNPEFIQRALATQGKSITDGINNLLGDVTKGRISMSDETAFELGRNLAATPGAVVFENEVMQLIQYAPLTARVAKRPLLVVPPCINKYYVMDLQAENSLVRYIVEQGHTVFLISWRNPQAAQGGLTWDDYLEHGPIAALEVVRRIARGATVNALGFCVGGTLLASALAVLAARGENGVASLTLLTTLLDFADTGEIGLLIDETSVQERERSIGQGGLLPARDLQNTFSFLRANDLVWHYVAQHYLKGEKPAAFDLLYWNADSTNLPGPFAAWYFRHLYLENRLCRPGDLTMCGERIDLGQLTMPTYLLAAREDHIVPWQSAYQSTRLLGGECRFVLGASGHIAGVINPASKNKRNHWVNADLRPSAEVWLAHAEPVAGSWWGDWLKWLADQAGDQRRAPARLGNAAFKPIEPAPGRYVRERAI